MLCVPTNTLHPNMTLVELVFVISTVNPKGCNQKIIHKSTLCIII